VREVGASGHRSGIEIEVSKGKKKYPVNDVDLSCACHSVTDRRGYHREQRERSRVGLVTNFMLNLYFDKINFVKCLFFVKEKRKIWSFH